LENNGNSLLDLASLSVKLEELAQELESTKDIDKIEEIITPILHLMKRREEYYYQFSHGGTATGFGFDSAELMISCEKIRAMIKQKTSDVTLEEHKKVLISKMRMIVKEIEGDSKFKYPSPVMTYVKGVTFPNAPTYFLSYSHEDEASEQIAERVHSKISATIDMWIDKYELKRHQQLPSEISDAIKKSVASLLILSKNFLDSKWCNEEWQAVFMKRLSAADYRLYIIRMDDAEYPPLLSPFFYTDCRGYPRPEALVELGKLLKEIETYEMYRRFRES
jgi:TIR domain